MMRHLLGPFGFFSARISRRAVLDRLARLGFLASVVPALSRAGGGEPDADLQALADLIRKLVPHPVAETVYLDAAAAIRGVMQISRKEIDVGLRGLEESASGELPAGDQFLARLRTASVEALYRDPRVWNLIGYGGNALAKGGYVATFNNIDWLPGTKR